MDNNEQTENIDNKLSINNKPSESDILSRNTVLKQKYVYARLSKYAPVAIKRLVKLLKSKNENIALGAAKLILSKVAPDLRQVNFEGNNGQSINFNLITPASYISAMERLNATPDTSSNAGSTEVQSVDMAQASEEDNNSNQPASTMGSA